MPDYHLQGLDFGAAARSLVNPAGNDRQRLLSRGGKPKDFRVENNKRIEAMLQKGREKRMAVEQKAQIVSSRRRPASSSSAGSTSGLGSVPQSTSRTALYTPEHNHRAAGHHICFADQVSPAPTPRPTTSSSSRPSTGCRRNDSSYLSGETTLNESVASAGEIPFALEAGEVLVLDRADDVEWERPHHVPKLGLHLNPMGATPAGSSSRTADSQFTSTARKGGRDPAIKTHFLESNRYQVHFTSTGIPYTSCHSPRVSRLRDADADSRLTTAASSHPSSKSAAPSPAVHRAGAVPKYLQQRKKELEADKEEKKRIAAIPEIPAGMRAVPDWEKKEASRRLGAEIRRLEQQFSALPLNASQTPGQRQRRIALERLMNEADRKLSLITDSRCVSLELKN